jgi:hypothetical protein
MLNAGWPALLAALSFLTTNLSDPLFGDILGALQVLAHAAYTTAPLVRLSYLVLISSG